MSGVGEFELIARYFERAGHPVPTQVALGTGEDDSTPAFDKLDAALGKAVADEIPRLRGVVDPALVFAASSPEECAKSDVEVWFLALPHGVAAEYAAPLVAAGKRVLDLSADFRLRDPVAGQRFSPAA